MIWYSVHSTETRAIGAPNRCCEMNKTPPQRWRGTGDAAVIVPFPRELRSLRSKMRGMVTPSLSTAIWGIWDYAVEVFGVVLAMRSSFSRVLRVESAVCRGCSTALLVSGLHFENECLTFSKFLLVAVWERAMERPVLIEYYQSWLRISVFILLRACLPLLCEEWFGSDMTWGIAYSTVDVFEVKAHTVWSVSQDDQDWKRPCTLQCDADHDYPLQGFTEHSLRQRRSQVIFVEVVIRLLLHAS